MTHIMKIDEMASGMKKLHITNTDLLKRLCEISVKEDDNIVKRIMGSIGVVGDDVEDIYFTCPSFADSEDNVMMYYNGVRGFYYDADGFRHNFRGLSNDELVEGSGLLDENDALFYSIARTDDELNTFVENELNAFMQGTETSDIDIDSVVDYFYQELESYRFNGRVRYRLSSEDGGKYIEVSCDYMADLINGTRGSSVGDTNRVLNLIADELANGVDEFKKYIIPAIKRKFFGGVA